MSETYPKDGSSFVTETIVRTVYRWAKYKPDGARQMGKPGRWQKQVWSGDYFKWENCEEPTGEISSPIEDGPISAAFNSHAALQDRVRRLEEALEAATGKLEGLSYIHDGNPSDALADMEPVEYARHMLWEARQLAKEGLSEVREILASVDLSEAAALGKEG